MLHKRTTAAGIKEGNLCLRGKYITAVPGEDTKTIETAGAYQWIFLRCPALVEIIAGYMLTDKDYAVIEKATLYDLRLIFSSGEKDTYTREEIVELLDKIAMAKDD